MDTVKLAGSVLFLSTLSLRRATRAKSGQQRSPRNFYPRSPCGERRVHYDNYNLHCVISIHALLAESDEEKLQANTTGAISIHALLAESDRYGRPIDVQFVFLSTLSLRRAT